jgi:hypothetical protein
MIRARIVAASAFLACLLVAAGPAHAEKRLYGLSQAEAGATLACSGESSLALGAYLIYETGKPVEEAVLLAKQSASGLKDPSAAERRMRAVYATKPHSAVEWGRRVFEQCLTDRKVPLVQQRAGNCYMLTFYLAAVVPVHKMNGHTPKSMLDLIVTDKADAAFRQKLLPIVEEYYARGTTDPRKNSIADLGRFLHCANPGHEPISDDAAAH